MDRPDLFGRADGIKLTLLLIAFIFFRLCYVPVEVWDRLSTLGRRAWVVWHTEGTRVMLRRSITKFIHLNELLYIMEYDLGNKVTKPEPKLISTDYTIEDICQLDALTQLGYILPSTLDIRKKIEMGCTAFMSFVGKEWASVGYAIPTQDSAKADMMWDLLSIYWVDYNKGEAITGGQFTNPTPRRRRPRPLYRAPVPRRARR